ncbi:MAG TPA: hypothetical protein VHG70_05665, partial [Nocardioidaceae bacterium]|nr:hypothetical protein [Nocardioidaceae bacterium]
MNRFYAPGRCPDCDALSSPQEARCPSCGLLLTGQVADDLRASLQYADRVLDVLRRVSADEGVAVPAQSAPAGRVPATAPRPPATARLRRGLPAVSVPVVLLGLGTICVLVAAIVFVAVTWTDLSLAWRTTILLSITALATAAAAWTVRKGLRGAAEALTLVAGGLLLIDLLAGNSAGLPVLSVLDGTAFGWLVALVMAGSGLAWALWVQRTATRSLVGQQVVTALASIEMTRLAALGWDYDREWLAAIVAVSSAAVGLLLWRMRVRTLAVAEGVLALVAWVYLATSGAVRAVAADGTRELLLDLQGAPLLAASALAAVVAVASRPSPSVRSAAAALAVAGPVAIALLPARELSPTTAAMVVAAAALALALAATVSPGPWRDGLRWVMVVTAIAPAASQAVGIELAVDRLVRCVAEYWTRALTDPLPALAAAPPVAFWACVPLGGLLVASAAVGLLQRPRTVLAAAAGGTAAGAVLGLLLTGWPLVVVNVVLAAAAVGGVTALVQRRDGRWWSGGLAVAVVIGLVAATPSATATIAFFTVHAVLLFVVAGLLRGPARSGLVFAGLVLPALSLQAVGDVARLPAATTGLLVLGLAVVVALVAQGTRMGTDRRSWGGGGGG